MKQIQAAVKKMLHLCKCQKLSQALRHLTCKGLLLPTGCSYFCCWACFSQRKRNPCLSFIRTNSCMTVMTSPVYTCYWFYQLSLTNMHSLVKNSMYSVLGKLLSSLQRHEGKYSEHCIWSEQTLLLHTPILLESLLHVWSPGHHTHF